MLNSTERTVLDMLLHGDHEVLATLRDQLVDIAVESREPTKTGVRTCFNVLESSPRLEHQVLFHIADVCADISGLQQPAIFILWIKSGTLKVLEAAVFDPTWPATAELKRAYYVTRPADPLPGNRIVEITKRDFDWALASYHWRCHREYTERRGSC